MPKKTRSLIITCWGISLVTCLLLLTIESFASSDGKCWRTSTDVYTVSACPPCQNVLTIARCYPMADPASYTRNKCTSTGKGECECEQEKTYNAVSYTCHEDYITDNLLGCAVSTGLCAGVCGSSLGTACAGCLALNHVGCMQCGDVVSGCSQATAGIVSYKDQSAKVGKYPCWVDIYNQ
jgi:hypothetical protein